MTNKEIKDLIKMVKEESGTNEFLSVSDLIVAIEQNYKEKGEILYYEDAGITFSIWNDFLRETPLSVDLFIGKDAIFEGFSQSKNADRRLTRGHDKIKSLIFWLFPPTESTVAFRCLLVGSNGGYESKTLHKETLHELVCFLQTVSVSDYLFLK